MTVAALLTTALLLLVTGTPCQEGLNQDYPITLTVYNSILSTNKTYPATSAYRGILLGAMRRLQISGFSFNFTTTEDPNYGPFLVSVNGVAGSRTNRTYWELLGQADNGTIIRADVGVGCYIPKPREHIILKFTKW